MSSLADAPDLVAFSATRAEDDEDSRREAVEAQRAHSGGIAAANSVVTKADFRLWQDKVAICGMWRVVVEDTIKKGISESVFFIPIITPTAVKSRFCELNSKHSCARKKSLAAVTLYFPFFIFRFRALADDRWRQDPLLETIGSRQYEQWQNLRHLDPSSTELHYGRKALREHL